METWSLTSIILEGIAASSVSAVYIGRAGRGPTKTSKRACKTNAWRLGVIVFRRTHVLYKWKTKEMGAWLLEIARVVRREDRRCDAENAFLVSRGRSG
jgi:hypothetical protein